MIDTSYHMQMAQGNVIPVLGLKGGVGKTTLAVNLAIGLAYAHPDSRTILIDASPMQGDVGVMFNYKSQYSLLDMTGVVANTDIENIDEEIINSITVQHESGLNMLLAPHYLHYQSDGGILTPENYLRVLETLQQFFSYIVVDTAATLDGLLAASIQTATGLMIVSTPSILSLKDTRILFNELAASDYSAAKEMMLVVNQYRKDDPIRPEHIQNFLNHKIDVLVPWDSQSERAINRSTPLILMSSKSAVSARVLRNMVEAVSERWPPPVAKPQPGTPLGTRQLRPPYLHPERDHICIVLVDDQESTRDLERAVIEVGQDQIHKRIKVEGTGKNGLEAIELAKNIIPDVMLLDINMPELDGMAAARQILKEYPSVAIIIVTVHESPEYWREAIKVGVADFIPKGTIGPSLASSIEEVYNRYQPIRSRFQPSY